MSAADRERKGSSWLSQLPSCLKTLISRTDDSEPRRTFRVLHMPDRPARTPSTQNIPTDEECLQHLLALQQQGTDRSDRDSGSEYRWQEHDIFPFIHGVGLSEKDIVPMKKCPGGRPPGLDSGKLAGWDAVVTKSMSLPFTPDSSGPWGSWASPQHGCPDTVPMTCASGPAPSKQRRADKDGASRALSRGTWPAWDPRRATGIAGSEPDWTPVFPRSSLPPDERDKTDDDDDVYDGWGEYYFDETNFRGREEGSWYIGRAGGYVGLPSIEEFI